ncbi:MAG: hypothetical protein DMG76_33750 [Acidobacteria bacterium]|nr:MAG: hypothetical protein DMG76_33750 [Acidobacteriota bacterium]
MGWVLRADLSDFFGPGFVALLCFFLLSGAVPLGLEISGEGVGRFVASNDLSGGVYQGAVPGFINLSNLACLRAAFQISS